MKSDQELKQDVVTELKWEPAVDEAHIGVTAKDGVVTLIGHIATYAERLGAERAAKRVRGVIAVANELDVRIASDMQRTDEEIATSCVHALRSHASVPDRAIRVTVSHGWVALEGTVDWQYEKAAAHAAVRYLLGVRGVTNSITLTPHASPIDVKAKIEAAFARSAELDAAKIEVETSDLFNAE